MTWWDAGEFLTAVETFGIPHPPGTPLYILLARAWATLLPGVDRAFAVNLLSGVCTAAAGALTAALVARAVGGVAWGVAAALAAGTMSTVWLNATEAEVYAASLLLSIASLAAGEWTGRTGDRRGLVLVAYLFALAIPLHATALIAGPAAIWLAADTGERVRWWWLAGLAATYIAAAGLATGRWRLGGITLVVAAVIAWASTRRGATDRFPWAIPLVVLLGASAVGYLLGRAPHDPALNQGNPETISAMLSVIARDQYDIPGLWPRRAPIWLQLANFFEWADWQVALGLAGDVLPSMWRTLPAVAFLGLGGLGMAAHRRRDRRSWRAMAILGMSASLGVIAYLNLRAGPSIGVGFLPDDAPHEPRERDYFFALAFWTWGIWAGIGALDFARGVVGARPRLVAAVGIAIASLPAALNWRATNRRAEPERWLPERFAVELLEAAPPRALLVVAGDNDTYPLWFAQQVRGVRRDVVVLTYPLVGADWYRAEFHRRWRLGHPPPHDQWRGPAEFDALAASARSLGRPIAAAVTLDPRARERFGRVWRLTGLVYVAQDSVGLADAGSPNAGPVIDVTAVRAAADRVAPFLERPLRASTDPTSRFMRESLRCPEAALRAVSAPDSASVAALDSICNYR